VDIKPVGDFLMAATFFFWQLALVWANHSSRAVVRWAGKFDPGSSDQGW